MDAGLCTSVASPHVRLLVPVCSSSATSRLNRSIATTRLLHCKGASWRGPSLRQSRWRVVAEKADLYRAFGSAIKIAKDVLDSGTKLVPEAVPRPLAQAGVAIAGVFVLSYLLQSIFSIALFVLAIGVVGYVLFVYLNKDDDQGGGGPSNGSSTNVTLEEARRIMDKYK